MSIYLKLNTKRNFAPFCNDSDWRMKNDRNLKQSTSYLSIICLNNQRIQIKGGKPTFALIWSEVGRGQNFGCSDVRWNDVFAIISLKY